MSETAFIHSSHEFNFFQLVRLLQNKVVFSSNSRLTFHASDVAAVKKVNDHFEMTCNFMGLIGIHGALPYQYLLSLDHESPTGKFIKLFENNFYQLFYELCNPFPSTLHKAMEGFCAFFARSRDLNTVHDLNQLLKRQFPTINYGIDQAHCRWEQVSRIGALNQQYVLGGNILLGNKILRSSVTTIQFDVFDMEQMIIIYQGWSHFLAEAKIFPTTLVKTIKFCEHLPRTLGRFRLGCGAFSLV